MTITQRKKEVLERRMALLPGLGWKRTKAGRWRSPRGARLSYDETTAIHIEQLRGGIREPGKTFQLFGLFENGNNARWKGYRA